MFGFGKSIKDPLADAKTAERWLVDLSGQRSAGGALGAS